MTNGEVRENKSLDNYILIPHSKVTVYGEELDAVKWVLIQPAFTYSMSTMETPEHCVKSIEI